MQEKAVSILNENRIMAIATARADGWPQSTLVGYANKDLLIYFIVSREGQKFASIQRDDRVSLSIGRDFHDPSSIRALSIAGRACEITDTPQRKRAVEMLLTRHPGLRRLEPPEPSHSAVMLIFPNTVTILDYSKGFGHSDVLTVSPGGVEMTPARDDDWGFGLKLKPTT